MKNIIRKGYHRWNRTWKPADISELSIQPCSRKMGWERGTPVDRVYIERFLQKHKDKICGTVVEIAEDTYSKQYGTNLEKTVIFTADEKATGQVIVGDLQSGAGVQEGFADCFILTQTLPFIYDVKASCENIVKSLKQGGYALITVRGISMVSKYDEQRWGDYWGFTRQSLKKLFDMSNVEIVDLVQYGNMKTAIGFMCGLAYEDLEKQDFAEDDELYPVLLGIVIRKNKFTKRNTNTWEWS